MTTAKDILDVCGVEVVKEEFIGWKRTLIIRDANGSEYRALLIYDTYDGYEFIPLNIEPLSNGMIDLMQQDDFEPMLDELTFEWEKP
jgi:hypothetical protein